MSHSCHQDSLCEDIEHVIPLRLSGGAFAVYQQLSAEEKQNYERIKAALYKVFDPAPAR